MNQYPSIAPSLFRPRFFLVGLLAGLILCALLGRLVSKQGYHDGFTRFHVNISPEGQYYPTIDEMCGIVRSRCRPDQVLVIVGGNSIFHGVGQPVGKIWTEELQRLLGDQYVVINFAFRGALCTDGGAVVAEVLRDEYPRQIYLANTSPFSAPEPYGLIPYRYLFLNARFRGLLMDEPIREKHVAEFTLADSHEIGDNGWFGLRGGGLFVAQGTLALDQTLRFHDLWNWVGYNYIFTIPSVKTPTFPQALWPRKRFADNEDDFDVLVPLASRFGSRSLEAEMAIVRGFTSLAYQQSSDGQWNLNESTRDAFMRIARLAMPDRLKGRTLIMQSRNCPFYYRRLDASEKSRDDLAYRDAVTAWQEAGYRSAEYGKDFEDADFGDRTHLSASGGVKLAHIVANETKDMAQRLGFLKEVGQP